MANNTVFYHHPCPDGVMAAFCAHLALTNVTWVPMTVYSKPEQRVAQAALAAGRDAYVLDYTGGPDFLRAVAAVARRVVVLDHHKTAAEDCAGLDTELPNVELLIDMSRSGAGIARDYFKAAARLVEVYGEAKGAALLSVVDYVEDNDLWRHALPDSQLVALGFHAARLDLDASNNPALFHALASLTVNGMREAGRAAKAAQDTIVAAELSGSRAMSIPSPSGGPPLTALALVTAHPDYRSVEGNALAEKSASAGYPAVGIVAYTEPGLAPGPSGEALIKVSLRSTGAVDTTATSKAYGGGGHLNASSFNVELAVFNTWWCT